jgi:catechol 2,3-dioxygenase-like lactoylglutathione lyase family enzyme
MKWNHMGIKTSAMEKSLHFYCDILGLRKLETVTILGKNFYFVGNDTITLEIEEGNPADRQADMRNQTGLYHLAFTVEDLEKTAKMLEENSVNFILKPSQFRPDRKIAFIEDPDGVLIQLIEYLPVG